MRAGLAALLVGAAALGLGACKPAGGPATAGAAPIYACVSTFEGKTATCMLFSDVAGGAAGVDRLKRGCLAAPGQSFAAACPTNALVGCCTQSQPEGMRAETCFYEGGPLMGTPEQCAKDGGVWSAAP
jgi:hypothetical protein